MQPVALSARAKPVSAGGWVCCTDALLFDIHVNYAVSPCQRDHHARLSRWHHPPGPQHDGHGHGDPRTAITQARTQVSDHLTQMAPNQHTSLLAINLLPAETCFCLTPPVHGGLSSFRAGRRSGRIGRHDPPPASALHPSPVPYRVHPRRDGWYDHVCPRVSRTGPPPMSAVAAGI